MNNLEKKELRRLVKNFNSKIRYYKIKDDKKRLPKPLKVGEIEKYITDEKDYNNWVKLLKSAKAKDAFDEVVIDEIKTTKWETERYYLAFQEVEEEKKQRRKKYGFYSEDELIKKGLGNVYESENLLESTFPLYGGKKVTWDKFTKKIEERLYKIKTNEYLKQYRKNYYKSLRYLGSGANIIKRYLANKSDEFIVKAYYTDPFLHIEYNYPIDIDDPNEYLWIVNRVLNAWKVYEQKVENGNI